METTTYTVNHKAANGTVIVFSPRLPAVTVSDSLSRLLPDLIRIDCMPTAGRLDQSA